MKTLIAMFMILNMIAVSGCWSTSKQGGIAPTNEEFSITVPSSIEINQGESKNIAVSLNRGGDFKQDVQLDIKANGIRVTPTSIFVKSTDSSVMQVSVTADRNTSFGDYVCSIKGTPTSGKPTSTVCTVHVVSP